MSRTVNTELETKRVRILISAFQNRYSMLLVWSRASFDLVREVPRCAALASSIRHFCRFSISCLGALASRRLRSHMTSLYLPFGVSVSTSRRVPAVHIPAVGALAPRRLRSHMTSLYLPFGISVSTSRRVPAVHIATRVHTDRDVDRQPSW